MEGELVTLVSNHSNGDHFNCGVADKELVAVGGDDKNAEILVYTRRSRLPPQSPISAELNRPVRLRKSVERLVDSADNNSLKTIRIQKGNGTKLRDIPKVRYNLSRKRNEGVVKVLHSILFSRRGKASEIRGHVMRFSGFVWQDNEVEERKKVRRKLDKYAKDKLVEVCRILDISGLRAKANKEQIITMLMAFLEAPNAENSLVTINQEQSREGQKRQRSKSTEKKLEEGANKIDEPEEEKGKKKGESEIIEGSDKGGEGEDKKLAIDNNGTNKDIEEKSYPSDLHLQQEIRAIITELDIDKATVGDIVRILVEKFGMELNKRKISIRLMIQDEINKFEDAGDDDDDAAAES